TKTEGAQLFPDWEPPWPVVKLTPEIQELSRFETRFHPRFAVKLKFVRIQSDAESKIPSLWNGTDA
ncbi:hypothetical protein AVEN_241148-1, partial [Araneus ventricosus]